jgi:hypothetical protein
MLLTIVIVALLGLLILVGYLRQSRRLSALQKAARVGTELIADLDTLNSSLEAGGVDGDVLRKTAITAGHLQTDPAWRTLAEPAGESDLIDTLRLLRKEPAPAPGLFDARQRSADTVSRLNDEITRLQRSMVNPAALFTEGIRAVLATPLRVANLTGLMDRIQVAHLENGRAFQLIGRIGAVAALLASAWSIIRQYLDYYATIFSIVR